MAIVLATAFEWLIVHAAFKSSTILVMDVAALDGSFVRDVWHSYEMPPLNADTLIKVFPLAIIMSAVGLLESLMTLNLIDELTKTRGSAMRECIGQGVANMVCGALGGMGGCAMIGQSMINISSGARNRISSVSAGLGLLIIVLVAYPGINRIPVSALVGVMFNVVYHTMEWSSLKLLVRAAMPAFLRRKCFASEREGRGQKIRRADALVILVVTVVTMFTDLATAVAIGMLISCAMFVYDTAKLISVETREASDEITGKLVKFYDVHGMLFFGSVSKFLDLFDEVGDPEEVRVVFQSGYIADHSAVVAINKLGERYGAHGKRVTLQELKPASSRIMRNANGLLVNEITLGPDMDAPVDSVDVWAQQLSEESGDTLHLNIERFRTYSYSSPTAMDSEHVSSTEDEEASGS